MVTITGIISDYALIKSFEKSKLAMRQDFFKKLQDAPFNFLSGQRSGELNYRLFVDIDVIENFFSRLLINMPIDILFTVIIGVIMCNWQRELTLLVFFVLLLQIAVVAGFRKTLLKYSIMQKSKSQNLSGFVVERFRNIQLIKSLGIEDAEFGKFKESLFELMRINIRSFMMNRLSSLTVTLINNIWSFGILWYGGILVLSEEITLGTMMAFLLISGMLYPRIASVANMILSFQDVRVSLYRYLEYYRVEPMISESPDAEDFVVESGEAVFENVSFGYDNDHPVLKGISARFKPGTITAIVGSSGVGKTTLARLLIRLYDPADGRVLVDGRDIRSIKLKSLRKGIGYALQGEFLFSGSIWDNISYGIEKPVEEEVIAAARRACAYDFIMGLPDNFSTQVGEGGLRLSGGEAQRIALARLFLNNYKIIVLDEPTSFIDNSTEAAIQDTILSIKQTATVIVIAHRLSTSKIADNILVMEDGKIVEEGNHRELLAQCGFYAYLYHSVVSQDRNEERFLLPGSTVCNQAG